MPTQKEILHIYTRVSTEVQASDGTSLNTQSDLGIKRASELGFGYKIWNEGAASSHHEDIAARPKLSELLTEIRNGDVKHLWVFDQSRLSRNDFVASTIRYECNKAGVTLYTKDGHYDLSNPTDAFTRQILDATSQLENALRAERSRIGKLQRVKEGQWHGGPPPFGYEIKNRKLAIASGEAEWVFKIFDAYASGSSTAAIKGMLDQNGVLPRRKKGTWSIGSLQALMKNTHYRGTYRFQDSKSGETVDVKCPRIVEDTLWHACQSKLKTNQKSKQKTNPTKRFYLLRDIMVCGHCDKPMSGRIKPSKRENFYYCANKERNWEANPKPDSEKWKRGTGCGMDRSLNIPITDAVIWGTVKEVAKNSVTLKERVKSELLSQKAEDTQDASEALSNLNRSANRLKKRIKQVEVSIAKIETDHMLEKTSDNIYANIRENLDQELENLSKELAQVDLQLGKVAQEKRWVDWVKKFEDQMDSLDDLSQADRKQYIEGLVDRLVVRLDEQTKEHLIEVQFQLPIVEDQLEYKDETNKSLGYDIGEGKTSILLRKNLRDRAGVKKNQVELVT